MAVRDIYLKIEQIAAYSPVEPELKVMPPRQYRRDCMRNPGHENALIPAAEVEARRMNAVVYREYLDATYLVPKPDKIVAADINEPAFHRRVPGTVIYASPGDRLRIHVLNADTMPHSFHLHGLAYGIDSDGSWPFGTQADDGRRSDEICPGQHWTYTFDVTNESVGAWPFHDHSSSMIGESINRGLFGGVVVRPRGFPPPGATLKLPRVVETFLEEPHRPSPPSIPPVGPPPHGGPQGPHPHGLSPGPPPPLHGASVEALAHPLDAAGARPHPGLVPARIEDARVVALREFLEDWAASEHAHPRPHPQAVLEVPLFFHFMNGLGGTPAFNSGPLPPGAAPFEVTFGAEGTFGYHCNFHPNMQGTVVVAPGNPMLRTVDIQDVPDQKFIPASVAIAPGGTVRWIPGSAPAQVQTHTVTENASGMPSYCFNGRTFVGNSPTIVANAGQKIRWYVFNLDVGMMWHNFHTHAQRWTFAGETIDTRSLGPVESFVVDTIAPPVLLLPPELEKGQDEQHRPKEATEYRLRGDFLFHCHVEMHMMQGLAGLVRSHQSVWLTPKQAEAIAKETGLPLDPGTNDCPTVVLDRCEMASCGEWEEVPDLPGVTMMHAALVPETDRVLMWGYGDRGYPQCRLWDLASGYVDTANQPGDVAVAPPDPLFSNLHSAGHAYTADGKLLAHGGETADEIQSFLFDPAAALPWSRHSPTAEGRFYATTLTLADGKLLTLFGNGGPTPLARSIEVFDPGTGNWSAPKQLPSDPADPLNPVKNFDYIFYPWTYLLPGGELFIAGYQGITRRFDWTPTPITQDPAKIWNTIAGTRSPGGGEKGTSVLLPLRPPNYEPRVLIAAGSTPAAQQSSEMIDLSLPAPAWTPLPDLNVPRPEQCNSILLPDATVLITGGVTGSPGPAEILDTADPAAGWKLCAEMAYVRGYHSAGILLKDGSVLMGGDPAGETTPCERFLPPYFFLPRPTISNAPASVSYGANFTIDTPDASSIAEVVLLRPGAVTHGWNMSQRFVGCAVTGGGAASLQVDAPPDGNVAPPGDYLLFIVNGGRVPSEGRWIRLTT